MARVQRKLAVLDPAITTLARLLALRLDLANGVLAVGANMDLDRATTIGRLTAHRPADHTAHRQADHKAFGERGLSTALTIPLGECVFGDHIPLMDVVSFVSWVTIAPGQYHGLTPALPQP